MIRNPLTRLGVKLLMALALGGVLLFGLHSFGVINAWRLPLKTIAIFFGGGGIVCLLLGCFRSFAHVGIKRWLIGGAIIGFVGLNAIAFLSAYGMTHLCSPGQFCLGLPRPISDRTPSDIGLTYTTERIDVSESDWIENWFIPAAQPSHGTVLLFPGNGGSKATQLLAPAQAFHDLGYDALLVDFRGVGGSSGYTTTLGTREAEDVALVMAHAQSLNLAQPLILYGVSMGTAAIMKATAQQSINPNAIVLELPFVNLVDSVKSRLEAIKVPSFPLAELIVFWGSIQHNINGFTHNPIVYAQNITQPTLVLQGDQDKWIQLAEIEALVENLRGYKQLMVFPKTGHQLLVTVDRDFWQQGISRFLQAIE